jgi:hypothetical protein
VLQFDTITKDFPNGQFIILLPARLKKIKNNLITVPKSDNTVGGGGGGGGSGGGGGRGIGGGSGSNGHRLQQMQEKKAQPK